MKLNVKAALLSGLVLPGLGQIASGRRNRGIVIILLVNLFIFAGLGLVLHRAGSLAAAARSASDASALGSTSGGTILLLLFGILWAYSFIDALLDRSKRD